MIFRGALTTLVIIAFCAVNGRDIGARQKAVGLKGSLKNAGFDHVEKRSTVEVTDEDALSLRPHSRQRRGWGSVVFYGTSILVRSTSAGLTIAAAATDGCSFYKSICEDRDAIKALDKKILALKKQYDQEYAKSATEWVNLRNASINNGYISYYVDEVISKVQTLSDLESKISDELELRIPKLFEMWRVSQNITSEDYLNILVGRLEYSLADLEKMLKSQAKEQLVSMTVQILVEATINKFVSSYKKSYNQIRTAQKIDARYNAMWTAIFEAPREDARILLYPDNPEFNRVAAKYGLDTGKITSKGRVKLAPKVFAKMFDNTKKYFAGGVAGIKRWKQTASWNGFKRDVKSTMAVIGTKMGKVKTFFTNAQSRKYTVKQFKLDFTTRIMEGIGIIVDIIDQAIAISEWAKVANEMTKARKLYQEYFDGLSAAMDSIKEEKANITKEWSTITDTFTSLSTVFKELVQNASDNADFADVLGLPRLPVSPNSPLSTINFGSLDKTTAPTAQESVLKFLKQNDNNLTRIVEKMRARQTLYTSVNSKTDKSEPVTDILSDLSDIYRFSSSGTVRKFGKNLRKQDVVCTISVLSPARADYDYYQLPPFRPRCDVSSSAFVAIERKAANLRKMEIMRTVVDLRVKKDSSLSVSTLLGYVQNAYILSKDNELITYGNALTDQDIVCAVATQFSGMPDFDFISLAPFRPDCSAVSTSKFATMKQDSERLRKLSGQVSTSLQTCEDWGFCPCIPMMAQQYGAKETEVTDAIRRLKPSMTEYCGTTGCACVTL